MSQPNTFQEPVQLGNGWLADTAMQGVVHRLLPGPIFSVVEPIISTFAARCAGDVLDMHWDASANPPWLRHFDANGVRVDRIVTSDGWRSLKGVAATEGLVATAYERDEYGQHARVVWASKMLLFGPSSGLYNCPLAMTDGAARMIECCDDEWVKEKALPHLLSRDPKKVILKKSDFEFEISSGGCSSFTMSSPPSLPLSHHISVLDQWAVDDRKGWWQ